jgi:hypothetical protein
MSDVLDIIQKINYEADTTAIEVINDEFGDQLELINKSQQKIEKYSKALSALSADQQRQAQVYTGLIEREQRSVDKITEGIGRQIGANKKLSNTVVDLSGKMKNLQFAGSQLVREAPAFAFSLQTGLIGISNNIPILIDQLKAARAAGASTTEIFKTLGASVFGLVGLISVAIPLLINFGGSLFGAGEDAKKATEEYDKFIESLGKTSQTAIDNTIKQIDKLSILREIINGNTSASNLAFETLKKQYPVLLKNIANENQLRGNPKVLAEINRQISAKEKSNALGEQATKIVEEQTRANAELNTLLTLREKTQKRIDDARARGGQSGAEDIASAQVDLLNTEQKIEDKRTYIRNLAASRRTAINESARQAEQSKDLTFQDIITEQQRKAEDERKKNLEKALKDREKLLETYQKIQRDMLKDEIDNIGNDVKGGQAFVEAFNNIFRPRFEAEIRDRLGMNGNPDAIMTANKFLRDKETAKKKEANDKKLTDSTINSAKLTRDILIQFADDVFTHQAELLDREIALRQRNMEIGLKLLERGNSEVLKQEQERLDEAQKKRDEVGQKQIALNAALQASSIALTTVQTLQAIANVASSGDPYTAPLRIAATIAAITAGFASMIALGKSLSSGFADGGYTGDGGKYEPKGIVHGGEYVINKEQTSRHRGVLEAINKGQYSSLVAAYGSGDKAVMQVDRTDELIDAISRTEVRNDIRINDSGIYAIYTRHSRKNRSRFR